MLRDIVSSKYQQYTDTELLHLEPGSSFSVIGSSRSSIFHYVHTPCPFLGWDLSPGK
jgi:hypothetical protein